MLSLGVYPDVTLKQARERRDRYRALVADGVNPAAQRHAKRKAEVEPQRTHGQTGTRSEGLEADRVRFVRSRSRGESRE